MAVKALTGTKESQRDMDGYVNRQRLHDSCCVPANTQARDIYISRLLCQDTRQEELSWFDPRMVNRQYKTKQNKHVKCHDQF